MGHLDLDCQLPRPLAQLLMALVGVAERNQRLDVFYVTQQSVEESGAFDFMISDDTKGEYVIVPRLKGNPIASLEQLGFVKRLNRNNVFLCSDAFRLASGVDAASGTTSGKMGNHIFISYSRGDQNYVRNLENDLRKRGFEVWIDDRIEFGDRWWQTIDHAIRGCAAFVVVMTPDSEKSEWVEKEVMLAQRQDRPVFPLLLCGKEFSLLIDTQYVDVIGGKMPPQGFYDRLLKHVLPEQAAPQPTADRQPSVPETVFDPPDTDTRIRTWQYDAGSGVAAVDVSPDGETVVAGTLGKRVLCLDSEGHQRWQAEVGNQAWRVALSADGGTTVVGTGSTRPWDMGGRGLYCFDGDGSLRWQVELKASVWGLDLSADGETVAAGTDARQLILFDGRGNRLWHQDVRGLGWYAWVRRSSLIKCGQ